MEYHRRSFVSDDERLRHNGFRILSRPRHGEPVWFYLGVRWFQSHALAYLADQERKAEAIEAEERKRGK